LQLTHKDLSATVLTTLVVLTYLATHEGWDVPVVGSSHRWAAAVILVLGINTCAKGSKVDGPTMIAFALLGSFALVLGVLALWTGSLAPLSLLVVDIVVLWALATAHHALHAPNRPAPTS
jgi:hypothetical protein